MDRWPGLWFRRRLSRGLAATRKGERCEANGESKGLHGDPFDIEGIDTFDVIAMGR